MRVASNPNLLITAQDSVQPHTTLAHWIKKPCVELTQLQDLRDKLFHFSFYKETQFSYYLGSAVCFLFGSLFVGGSIFSVLSVLSAFSSGFIPILALGALASAPLFVGLFVLCASAYLFIYAYTLPQEVEKEEQDCRQAYMECKKQEGKSDPDVNVKRGQLHRYVSNYYLSEGRKVIMYNFFDYLTYNSSHAKNKQNPCLIDKGIVLKTCDIFIREAGHVRDEGKITYEMRVDFKGERGVKILDIDHSNIDQIIDLVKTIFSEEKLYASDEWKEKIQKMETLQYFSVRNGC